MTGGPGNPSNPDDDPLFSISLDALVPAKNMDEIIPTYRHRLCLLPPAAFLMSYVAVDCLLSAWSRVRVVLPFFSPFGVWSLF